MSSAVHQVHVHAVGCGTQFRLWNGVSLCNNNEVISTSGLAVMLTLTVENTLSIVAVGHMLLVALISSRYFDMEWCNCYH